MLKERLEEILFKLPQLIFVCDKRLRIIYINQSLLSFLGYKKEKELLGSLLEKLIPKLEKERLSGIIKRILLKNKEIEFFPTSFESKDKKNVKISFSGFPLLDSEDKVYAVLGVASDFKQLSGLLESLRRAKMTLEKGLKERTNELESRAEELEKSKEILQERVDELERFKKLTVGRELKMAELKEEIDSLRERLKNFEKQNGL